MEINFQQQQQQRTEMPSTKTTKTKGRNKAISSKNKFIGVRRRASGRWVAEIKDTTKKIRMWLGTFETPEEAARAYDQAARLLRGSNTRTNFAITQGCASSPLASRIRNLLNSKRNGAAAKKEKQQPLESLESCRDLDTSASIMCSDDSALTCTMSTTSSSSLDHTDTNITHHDQDPSSAADKMMTMNQLFNGFDDAYKPDLSDCTSSMGEVEGSCLRSQPGSAAGASAWGYDCSFSFAGTVQELLLDFQPESSTTCDHFMMKPMEASSEFERMKVERQISASLYAINGVHECMEKEMEALHYGPYPITDHGALLWDLPPLCSSLSI